MNKYLLSLLSVLLIQSICSGQSVTLVEDLEPGTSNFFEASFEENNPIIGAVGNDVYFRDVSSSGTDLYRTVTPSLETELLLTTGSLSDFIDINGKTFFSAFENGESQLYAIENGSLAIKATFDDILSNMIEYKSELYFNVDELFMKYDGLNDPELVYEFDWFGGIRDITATDSHIFLIGSTDDHRELFISDGTNAGTSNYYIINTGSEFNSNIYMTPVGDKVYFFYQPNDEPYSLYVTDGTANGTLKLKEFKNISFGNLINDKSIAVFNDKLYFNAWLDGNPQNNYDMFVSDGTVAGTKLVFGASEIDDRKDPKFFQVYKDELYFRLRNSFFNNVWLKLTKTNPNPQSIFSGIDLSGTFLSLQNDNLIFAGAENHFKNTEIYTYAGGGSTPILLTDISSNEYSAFPFDITPVNDLIFFVANNEEFGRELFVYDPVISNTSKIDLTSAKVYPTIAKDMIHLSTDNVFDKLEFVDANGRVVKQINNPNNELDIDVTSLAKGNYFVKLIHGNSATQTLRFIKQ